MEYQANEVASIASIYHGFRNRIEKMKSFESFNRGKIARQLLEKLPYYKQRIPAEVLNRIVDLGKLEKECMEIMKKFPEL